MNNVALWSCRVFIGIQVPVLLTNGFIWAFMPDYNFELYSVVVDSAVGMSMVKSDIGGSLMTLGIFTALFLIKGRQWFAPLMIFFALLLVVRAVSLFTDGLNNVAVFGVVMEALFMLAAYALNRMQNSQ